MKDLGVCPEPGEIDQLSIWSGVGGIFKTLPQHDGKEDAKEDWGK